MINRSVQQIILCIVVSVLYISCGNVDESRPTSAQETGQQFIASSLKGDFKKAESLLLNEPENKTLFQTYRRFYDRMSEQQRKGYQTASFEIESWQDLNDSTSIIRYTNDFMHQPTELRLVRKNDQWWIDFRFTSTEK
jgi:hypothetical protein